MDKSTDKLRDHVCDKGGGEGVKKFEIFMDIIDGSPQTVFWPTGYNISWGFKFQVRKW